MWASIKKDNVFLLLLLGIILISSASAQTEQSPGTYRLGEDALLIQTCDNCTYVNITDIILGNKTRLEINAEMTQNNGFFFYVLDNNYTTYPGEYVVSGIANPDGSFVRWNYKIEITQLAITQSTSQAIGSAIYLALMVILMFVFGFVGFKLSKSNTWWVLGIFFMFLCWIFLIYNTFLGYQYHKIFTGLPDSATPERIFWMLLAILIIGLAVSIGLLFLRWREVLRYVKKEIKRKEPNDEDLEDWDFDKWNGEDWKIRK